MVISEGLPFIVKYVSSINDAIKSQNPEQKLTKLQKHWLSFVILGVLYPLHFKMRN